ncbi:13003_t:CDS:2 [Racocetra fulgida]|uniref:13003_t:CDS:1 n=1 Tax=Racocetra fulgida TaxID=60492 RepID=A0A9N8VN90_9GLOM|nr:13003_t:CDS:2 [Racocetra fulgida]
MLDYNLEGKSEDTYKSNETNNSVEDERQATNVEVTVNKRKKVLNRTNVKKRRGYEEPNDEPSLRSAEDYEAQATNMEVTANNDKGKKSSNRTNTTKRIEIEPNWINSDNEQTSKASSSSSLIGSSLSYNKRPIASKASSFSDRSDSPESIYSERSPLPNIASFPLINHSFEDTNSQHPLTSNKIDNSSTSFIGPFKNDLELCLYLVQHTNLIKLTTSMIEADSQGSTVIQEKDNKFNVLSERARQPEMKQISEYITESNWEVFLKRHIDILDLEKTFRKWPENVVKFTKFIRSAFNLFVQENLLDKDVINEVKDLNYMTVNMIIFTADGNDSLQQLDLGSLLKFD